MVGVCLASCWNNLFPVFNIFPLQVRVLKPLFFCASAAVVSMFTLPVVYEKHQVGMHINSSQLRFGKNIAQLLKSLLFLGTNWSVRGTNTDPGQLCGGQVSGCHSVMLFEELFLPKKGGKKVYNLPTFMFVYCKQMKEKYLPFLVVTVRLLQSCSVSSI